MPDLESLPNEVLIDIFHYFNAQELFAAFDDLNSRFSCLLRSFSQLKLAFAVKKEESNIINSNNRFPLFVYTLHIHPGVEVSLTRFPNVRRLKLDWPSNEKLEQLFADVLPHLEQLTLVHIGIETFPSNHESMYLPSLRVLKVRFINLSVYQTTLSACPNLHYFQLAMFTSEDSPVYVLPHANLKQLIINVGDVVWPWNDSNVDKYLVCTLAVERFSIHRLLYISRIPSSFLDYDWLASVIGIRFQTLEQLTFHLRSFSSKHLNKKETEDLLNQIKQRFIKCHDSEYQSRLIIEHSQKRPIINLSRRMSRFEQIPNELLLCILEYFRADELSRTFFNLNQRLTNLVKTVSHLSLTISKDNQANRCILSPYVSTLTLDESVDISLDLFTHVTRLILKYPMDKLLSDLCTHQLDKLEHLVVIFNLRCSRVSDLERKIFTGGFRNLRSYHSTDEGITRDTIGWTQAIALRILKFSFLNLLAIKAVLSACPNLYYLDTGVTICGSLASKNELHAHLKHLIVRAPYNAFNDGEYVPVPTSLFGCVPNVEKLSLHRKDNIAIINRFFIKYGWMSTIIPSYFRRLRRFHYYLHILHLKNVQIVIGPRLKENLNQAIARFYDVYNDRCLARLTID